ncbi:hypothetical protein ACQ4PT_062748 [Festuca glaucescens]
MALVSHSLPSPCASKHLLATSPSRGCAGSRGRLPAGNGVIALTAAPAVGRRGVVRWRAPVSLSSFSSFLPSFFKNNKEKEDEEKAARLKEELLAAIAPLDRGAEATPEDKDRVEEIARRLEEARPAKEPLKSDLLNGKWELLYTTSTSILQPQRPKFLRPFGTIYQAINIDTLRAQNMETLPYFNQVIPTKAGLLPQDVQVVPFLCNSRPGTMCFIGFILFGMVTANLVPLTSRRVAVKFDYFKIFSLIQIKAPGRGKGELEITYLDEELRVSRGDKGNLFVLKMVDPTYRVPL